MPKSYAKSIVIELLFFTSSRTSNSTTFPFILIRNFPLSPLKETLLEYAVFGNTVPSGNDIKIESVPPLRAPKTPVVKDTVYSDCSPTIEELSCTLALDSLLYSISYGSDNT